MKTDRLRVVYVIGEGIDRALDEELIALLRRLGWLWWGGGFNLESGERDLAFERKRNEEQVGQVSVG